MLLGFVAMQGSVAKRKCLLVWKPLGTLAKPISKGWWAAEGYRVYYIATDIWQPLSKQPIIVWINLRSANASSLEGSMGIG
jgi:hypothetical protein